MSKIKVIYLGYDIDTLFLLSSDDIFEVVGVGIITDLVEHKTNNPVDFLFKRAYINRIVNKKNSISIWLVNRLKVFTSPLFKKYNSYLRLLNKKKLSVLSDDDIIGKYGNDNVDLLVVNNWWLLPKALINIPRYGCVNVHPSKLPQYRGAVPTLWSLKNGDTESAVTYLILDNKMDSGKIIAQHLFKITEQDDAISLEKKIEHIVGGTLLSDIRLYITGQLTPYLQDDSQVSKTATFYEYMKIDFEKEIMIDIYNKTILYPYLNPIDRCYFIHKTKKIPVKRFQIYNSSMEPGQLLRRGKYVYFGCRMAEKSSYNVLRIKLFKDVDIRNSLVLI